MRLPVPRAIADALALRVHIALDATRRGKGSASIFQAIVEAMLMAWFITEAGFGNLPKELMQELERDINATIKSGAELGAWGLSSDAFERFAIVVVEFDTQLREVPLFVISDANARLERLRTGQHAVASAE